MQKELPLLVKPEEALPRQPRGRVHQVLVGEEK